MCVPYTAGLPVGPGCNAGALPTLLVYQYGQGTPLCIPNTAGVPVGPGCAAGAPCPYRPRRFVVCRGRVPACEVGWCTVVLCVRADQ